MQVKDIHAKYLENSVLSASPEELTLMLFNGLVRFIIQAQKAIDAKDCPKAHEFIIKSEAIVAEFQATLDMNYDISSQLMPLYQFMQERLFEANLKKDSAILKEVLDLATDLRDTWNQAMKIAKVQNLPEVAQVAK